MGTLEYILNPIDVGPVIYRRQSESKDWIIQVQFNKILFSWKRAEHKNVGMYPGYNNIREKFDSILSRFNLLDEPIKSMELAFHDRFFGQEYIENLGELGRILNYQPPTLQLGGVNHSPEIIENTCIIPLEMISGDAAVSIRTGQKLEEKQILSFYCGLKGAFQAKDDVWKWFARAHELQLHIFEDTFNQEILEKWR